ncbi:unnamed protein product [Ixodes persulcatus]
MSTHSCMLGNSTVAMLKKISTFSDNPAPGEATVAKSFVQAEQTVCRKWSEVCCRFPFITCTPGLKSGSTSQRPNSHLVKKPYAFQNHGRPFVVRIHSLCFRPLSTLAAGNTVSCPDGSSCLDQQTCCQSKNGSYGCCPTPEAVCCEDHETCCPKGTVCVEEIQACIGLSEMSPMLKKVPAFRTEKKPRLGRTVQCPYRETECAAKESCSAKGQHFMCCHFENGVHCERLLKYHPRQLCACCKKENVFALPSSNVLSPLVEDVNLSDVQCPDGGSCPDGQTCCQIQGGSYGCCPYEDATCCSDDVHCCPSGYECDTSATSCRKGDIFAAALRKFPARRPLLPVVNDATPGSIVCPNKIQHCPDGTQCCLSYDTINYFCCPYQNGTCCEDGLFCCKAGFRCFSLSSTVIVARHHLKSPALEFSNSNCGDTFTVPQFETPRAKTATFAPGTPRAARRPAADTTAAPSGPVCAAPTASTAARRASSAT